MGVFSRKNPAPKESIYTKYRTDVRIDFCECCAYCLLHEILAAGKENFELDHFRPKSKFPHLETEYSNIYYSCHSCNKAKWSHWPNEALTNLGFRYIDLCSEIHSDHFREEQDGRWTPLTKAAEYTAEKIRLNRPHLVQIRFLLLSIAKKKKINGINWNTPLSIKSINAIMGLE